MAEWKKHIRLVLAAIFGFAVMAEGVYTAQMRSSGEDGYVGGMIFGLVLCLVGALIFYSQVRYERKQVVTLCNARLVQSDSWGSIALSGIGAVLIAMGNVVLVATAIYFVVLAYSLYSGKEASGIPLAIGLFGGAFCYLVGDSLKKSG